MAGLARSVASGLPDHVTQRGNPPHNMAVYKEVISVKDGYRSLPQVPKVALGLVGLPTGRTVGVPVQKALVHEGR
jgi:hypothetical protein